MQPRPLRTTVIGSYPFPSWLEFASQHLEQFGVDEIAELQADAVVCAIHDQVAAGLDVITDGARRVDRVGGHAMMPRVTGLGCTATALCAAFAAVNKNPLEAALNACVTMKVAGEMAAERADGPGTLQLHLYDALYNMSASDVARRIKVQR